MEKLDMRKSSCEAWSLLKRQEGNISIKNTQVTVKAQSIAAVLVANSKGTIEREQIKSVNKELRKVRLMPVSARRILVLQLVTLKRGKRQEETESTQNFYTNWVLSY